MKPEFLLLRHLAEQLPLVLVQQMAKLFEAGPLFVRLYFAERPLGRHRMDQLKWRLGELHLPGWFGGNFQARKDAKFLMVTALVDRRRHMPATLETT